MIFEPSIVYCRAKPFDPNLPLADMGMAVDLRPQIGLRIIQMEGDDVIESED